jgi:CheY-like chemotaxis protein
MNQEDLTILHLEDDALLAKIVKGAFAHLGFRGDFITAGYVRDAIRVLNERMRNGKPVNLIISDMQLPDGTGLDLIREVKTDPVWRMTPVVVLSHDIGQGIINDAYALGANSYLSKVDASNELLGSLRSIYSFWLESAKLPRGGADGRLQESLKRAIALRNRTAEVYLRLASAFQGIPTEVAFWLDRALNEGNVSNLLAFFKNKVNEEDVHAATIDRLAGMQDNVKNALQAVENRLKSTPAPSSAQACRWALDLMDALDEEVFAEVLGIFFPISSVATTALKVRAAAQMMGFASHIRSRTSDKRLLQRAEILIEWSQRLSQGKK